MEPSRESQSPVLLAHIADRLGPVRLVGIFAAGSRHRQGRSKRHRGRPSHASGDSLANRKSRQQRQMVRKARPRFAPQSVDIMANQVARIDAIEGKHRAERMPSVDVAPMLRRHQVAQPQINGHVVVELSPPIVEVACNQNRLVPEGVLTEQGIEHLNLDHPLTVRERKVHIQNVYRGAINLGAHIQNSPTFQGIL